MKRFSHGNFTEAFIASVGNRTGVVRNTIELTERIQMIFSRLDLKYFYMWGLLILYILLLKKHYILKCVPVLTFGKKETVPVVQFKQRVSTGGLPMKAEHLPIKAIQVVCLFHTL